MFKVSAPIFETLTIERGTSRVRSIKPGEDVESMWDHYKANAHAFQYSPENKNPQKDMKEGMDQTFVYTEADEIEDSILFPEEGTGEMKDNVFRDGSEDMHAVEDDGDEAWETDEDEMDEESDGDLNYSFANTEDVEAAMDCLEDRFKTQTVYAKGMPQPSTKREH
jgi:hypothetical protein